MKNYFRSRIFGSLWSNCWTVVILFAAFSAQAGVRCEDLLGDALASASTAEFKMLEKYQGEDKLEGWGRVKYFSYAEREPLKIQVDNRRLVDHAGRPLANGQYIFVLVNEGREIFLVDESSRLNLDSREALKHSSLGQGLPVNSAGILTIYDGQIHQISNRSGHYQPNINSLLKVISEMERRDLERINLSANKLPRVINSFDSTPF